ncbi:DUF2911 domain-containing protein [Rubrivirga sp.]|uniref:DUF2911 domain-containing protein n=1 Tax=Rubrivirga sp. TaxID=1885344 RepID=UPI003C743BB9
MLRSISLAALALLLAAPGAFAQVRAADEARVSPNARIGTTVGTTEVDVTYGRPSLRDRAVFGDESPLAPVGQVWRVGANEAPTITFDGDVTIGGEMVPAGTYALLATPGDEWTVVLNKVANQWGAFRYDASQNQAEFMATPMMDAPMQEQFEIRFADVDEDSATMIMHWGTVGVPVEIVAPAAPSMDDDDEMEDMDGM